MSQQPPDGEEVSSDPATAGASTGGGLAGDEAPDSSVADAAADALRRARAGARAKGLRPGTRPRPRRRPRADADPTVSTGRDRDPALLGDQVERIVGDRGWGTDVAVGQVMGRWAEIVGREIAEHATPVTFEGGVLTVRADSTAWATQIRWLSASLLQRIDEAIGAGQVSEIRVQGPSAPSWSKGPRRTTGGRGPRDTYG